MREGDGIWILPGAGAALVLRKMNTNDEKGMKYHFVGEAYVHGIMNGEGVDCKELDLKSVVLD
jgi:ribosome-interacting GTPase 1